MIATMTRREAITALRVALRRRSGRSWSVTGGTGTAWGWIRLSAPPSRCDEIGHMSKRDRIELAQLLGRDTPIGRQGYSIPASDDHWREYIARANGLKPDKIAEDYWD